MVSEKEDLAELKKRIKDLLQYIEIARKSDHTVARWMFNSENLTKVTKPVEKFLGRGGIGKKEAGAIVEEIAEKTKGKTFKERREKLGKINKILKIS